MDKEDFFMGENSIETVSTLLDKGVAKFKTECEKHIDCTHCPLFTEEVLFGRACDYAVAQNLKKMEEESHE